MCGIISVMGPNAMEKSFAGLKALEYRGYDSWGIASLEKDSLRVEKHVGKIGNAKLLISTNSRIALGHTRWATHGKVLEKNAHPHLSNDGKIAIVHNGIVENFSELKKMLSQKGFTFNSDTDSEVIANLIQLNSEGKKFEEAVRISLLEIEGNYAIAAVRVGEEKIVCAKNGSPLVIGIGNNSEFYVASDATAFISDTKNAVFLNDGEMGVITGSLGIFDVASGKKKQVRMKKLVWNFEQAKKGEYEHFMIKEIYEQPEAIEASVHQSDEKIRELALMIKNADNVLLTGCGSSYHACLCGSYFFSTIASFPVNPMLASEYSRLENFFDKKTLVIGISQSGETADLIEALKAAKSKGAKVASIVNVMDSSVMRLSDLSISMNAGPEICVLSTKSYTSQVSILLLLAYALAGKEKTGKKILEDAAEKIKASLPGLDVQMKALAKKLANSKDIFVIGREEAYPTALEAALKIKEVSYIHAEGFAGGELKHGTIALIEEDVPAIVLSTPKTRMLTLSNAIEMKSRGAAITWIGQQEVIESKDTILIPDTGSAHPILLIIPVQLLSYYLALERKLDPDKPRNLAKSVTVK